MGLLFRARKLKLGFGSSSSLAHLGTMARWFWPGKTRAGAMASRFRSKPTPCRTARKLVGKMPLRLAKKNASNEALTISFIVVM
jgi:hypothetical protein